MSAFTLPAQQVLALAGDHLWHSTLLAALAALTATVLKRQSASIRYWIWFAASIKFLVPFAALVTLGGYASWRSVEVLPYRDAPLLIEAVGQPFAADAFSVRTAQRGAVARSVHNIPATLLWVWAIGATAVLLRSLGHWYRIRQLARGATPLDDGREVQILRVLGGGKQPLPIVSTDSSLEPGVFGIVRPVLLWPRAISERLSATTPTQTQAREMRLMIQRMLANDSSWSRIGRSGSCRSTSSAKRARTAHWVLD